MPLPIAHGLVGAGLVATLYPDFSLRNDWPKLLLGSVIAIIPDLDLALSYALGFGLKGHGGFTHSIVFALALGALAALVAREWKIRGELTLITAALSHAILDALTKKEFGGSQLFWPFSEKRYKLGLISNYKFYPDLQTQSFSELLQNAAVYSALELTWYLPPLVIVILFRVIRNRRQKLDVLID